MSPTTGLVGSGSWHAATNEAERQTGTAKIAVKNERTDHAIRVRTNRATRRYARCTRRALAMIDPAGTPEESLVQGAVHWLRLAIEATGAIVIAVGVAIAIFTLVRTLVARRPADFNAIRLVLARYLAMALEFQLGADILSTAVAPSWTEIGKLGAIAIIRTALNFFLSREMEAERTAADTESTVQAKAQP